MYNKLPILNDQPKTTMKAVTKKILALTEHGAELAALVL